MNIIITMAGEGSRFKRAGYNMPKYKIEVNGKSLFEWSMLSLENFNTLENIKYIFIVKKADNSRRFILEEIAKRDVKNVEIIEIETTTDGQATTALLAKEYWAEDEEMIVYNIDTYVEPNAIKYKDIEGEGFIPCFQAEGEHWSFAKLDNNGNVVEVREKNRISDYCTIGLYYFKTCKLYEKLYNEYYKNENNLEKGEKYIAPLYNYMIKEGMQVRICNIPTDKVHVLGTPEEVEQFKISLV